MARQSKEGKELREIFSELNSLNKGYALAVLRSLFFAQEHTTTSAPKSNATKQGEKTDGKYTP